MADISPGVDWVWKIAAIEAISQRHEFIDPEHLLIGVCKLGNFAEGVDWSQVRMPPDQVDFLRTEVRSVVSLFKQCKIDRVSFYRAVRKKKGSGQFDHQKGGPVHRSQKSRELFSRAAELADAAKHSVISTRFLLSALLETADQEMQVFIREHGADIVHLKRESHIMTDPAVRDKTDPKPGRDELPLPKEDLPPGNSPPATPHLDRYGTDLVQLAKEGKVSPVFSDKTKREMLVVSRALAQKTKSNPVLVGKAGVGKTAVVEGLACRIAQGTAPEILNGKRIVQLNMGGLVAGTKYRGEFEEKLQGILREASGSPDVILFIDEIHTVVGAGSAGDALDAANMMKPALSRGEIRCIGATTLDEYRKYIEKDPALERRFQPITVEEPSAEEALEIVRGVKSRLEAHHKVTITDAALRAAVDLSVRHLPDRSLPDKAIDLLDQACSEVTVKWVSILPGETPAETSAPGTVTSESVARILSKWTKIPVGQIAGDERARLLRMAEELKQRVIGQDGACDAVALAVQRARAGLKADNRPVGVFLFLGPTGVGKTALAKATASYLFGSEQALLRLDMSEFMEKHNVSRLIGAPPGYVGHEEEGDLTGKLRRTPYCVVLLDEIEKAHPDALTLFLQLFDEGRLTDAKGRTVDATHVLFIATSNLSAGVEPGVGFRVRGKERLRPALVKAGLRSEFVNRLDEIIEFSPLQPDDFRKILSIDLEAFSQRLSKQGIGLKISPEAIDLLCREGASPEFGARHLRRVIKQRLESPIAGMILRGEVQAGDTMIVEVERGELVFKVERGRGA
jgi:ATP-dependent Clp protease ATP-binding subunit ClpC